LIVKPGLFRELVAECVKHFGEVNEIATNESLDGFRYVLWALPTRLNPDYSQPEVLARDT
jgi:hypothetical protein